MDAQGSICRLCFKICNSFKAIEGELKGALDMIVKEIDSTVIEEPMMCAYCAEMLLKCSQFKTTCLNARDCIFSFINDKEDDLKLNLKEVYLSLNENGIGLSETQDICGFCMSPVESCSAVSINVEGGDILLQNMIEECLPELDFSIIKKPVICGTCHEALGSCFYFMTCCLTVEEKIKEYCETQDINGDGQIELNGLLEFMTRDMSTKVKEDVDKEEIANGVDILRVEQMLVDVKESVKVELELKNESCTEMGRHFMPDNMLSNEGNIKIEETFCEESELKEENVDLVDQLTEEIDMKTEESDYNRPKNDVLLLPEVATILRTQQKCSMQDFEEDLPKAFIEKTEGESNISVHSQTAKDPPEVTMYKCSMCSFQTKLKGSIKRHNMLKHTDPLEITMYQCDSCPFQTKDKRSLKLHVLKHKDPSEITMYKCDSCSFQAKHKRNLKRHLLGHKDPSEVTMYECDSCRFLTKYKDCLKEHLLTHKDPSEITMYKCDSCSFQTRHKSSLKPHMLKHKDPLEVTMYKCDYCSYQTKNKNCLRSHLLNHKNVSEVTMYKCDYCSYQAKRKGSLRSHLLNHKDTSEVTMYKCDSCSFETKRKESLKNHLLKHKDPSEVTMYKCDSCLYQTRYKQHLREHSLTHTGPSAVTIHECDSCSYQTRYKEHLKEHSLTHTGPKDVIMYKCSVCSYLTKLKSRIKRHRLNHIAMNENATYLKF